MLLDDEMREPLGAGPRSCRRIAPRPSGCCCAWPSARRPSGCGCRTRASTSAARGRACRRSTCSTSCARSPGASPTTRRCSATRAVEGGAKLDWPAPAQPADAIDDVEHDLATLRELIGTRRSRGGARPRALSARPQRRAAPIGDAALGARAVALAAAGRPGRASPTAIKPMLEIAAPRRAPVLAVGAAEVRDLPVSVPAVGDLSPRAERGAGAAAAARSADARLALPRGPGASSSARCTAHGRLPVDGGRRRRCAGRRSTACSAQVAAEVRGASSRRRSPRVARRDRRDRPRPARLGPAAAGGGRLDAGRTSSSASGCRTKGATSAASPSRSRSTAASCCAARSTSSSRGMGRRSCAITDHKTGRNRTTPRTVIGGGAHAAAGDLRPGDRADARPAGASAGGCSTARRPAASPSTDPAHRRQPARRPRGARDHRSRHRARLPAAGAAPSAPARGATSARSAAPTKRSTSRASRPISLGDLTALRGMP